MNISVVVFCFNESDSILKVLNNTLIFLNNFAVNYEVIIVNDGSTDKTGVIADEYCRLNNHFKVIHHKRNLGIGHALFTGYKNAQFEYVCAIPGDAQFNIFELEKIIPFQSNQFYSFYREKTDYNAYRNWLSKMNKLFNKYMLGFDLKDVNWIKVYRLDQIKFVDLKLKSSIIESEICAKLIKAGANPIEIKSVYNKRSFGVSLGGSWKTFRKVLAEVIPLFFIVSLYNKKITL